MKPRKRKLPKNWRRMSESEQDSWALTKHLQEELNTPRIVARFTENGEFDVYFDDSEISEDKVRAEIDAWYEAAYGAVPEVGEHFVVSDEEFDVLLEGEI